MTVAGRDAEADLTSWSASLLTTPHLPLPLLPCPAPGGASLVSLGLGTQADVPPVYGFAIQCRVTSEDPEQNFQVGLVLAGLLGF